jgi:hypothetical protein
MTVETTVPLREKLEEPPRSDHLGSQGLNSPPQLAIRSHECDCPVRGLRGEVSEHVIAAPRSEQDRDAVGRASLHTRAGGAFQDHDDRLGDSSRVNGRSHLVHEGSGCSCSVPPPASGTRSDHVGGINEKHGSGVIVTATGRATFRQVSPQRSTRPCWTSVTRNAVRAMIDHLRPGAVAARGTATRFDRIGR